MADENPYGTRHLMEEQMMADGVGVFEPNLGAKMRSAPANKQAPAPDNKANLSAMTKAQLVTEAKKRGVEIEGDDTKAEIIAKMGG